MSPTGYLGLPPSGPTRSTHLYCQPPGRAYPGVVEESQIHVRPNPAPLHPKVSPLLPGVRPLLRAPRMRGCGISSRHGRGLVCWATQVLRAGPVPPTGTSGLARQWSFSSHRWPGAPAWTWPTPSTAASATGGSHCLLQTLTPWPEPALGVTGSTSQRSVSLSSQLLTREPRGRPPLRLQPLYTGKVWQQQG